jgi:hypothetical protein
MYTPIHTSKFNDVDRRARLANVLGAVAGCPQNRLRDLPRWNRA